METRPITPRPLDPGSVAAKVVARVWSGQPGTLVSAAPGAGKTKLIVDVLTHLVGRAGLTVCVATPTREQAYAITARLFAAMGPGWMSAPIAGAVERMNAEVFVGTRAISASRPGSGWVIVKTIEAYRYGERIDCDLMVVDEGYQSTFASLSSAAASASQLLVVGDSGQIGPVVSEDVAVLERWGARAHHRAPDVLANRPDFSVLHLGTTYRLGPDTTSVVDLLYGFDLTSGRPHRELYGPDGSRWPELVVHDMGEVDDLNDVGVLSHACDVAIEAATGSRFDADIASVSTMSDADVAMVVSRNSQVALLRGMLDARGHGGIIVGTANKLQGGQWSAVVSVDPLLGVSAPGERDIDNGLLCVMLSRHTTHLTWVSGSMPEAIDPLGARVRARMRSVGCATYTREDTTP